MRERVHTFPDAIDLGAIPLCEATTSPELLRRIAQTLMVYQLQGSDFQIEAYTGVPEDQRFIEPPYRIHFFALDDESARPLTELTDRFGTVLAREPGIVLKRAVVPEDGISSLYEIEFWKQFKTHAAVGEE